MLAQSLRASRLSLARAVRTQSAVPSRRTLITPTAALRADAIQDMYLKELRQAKPSPEKAGDEKGHVKEFSMPKAPHSPEEADLQDQLKSYEDQVPEVEGASSGGSSEPVEDWFEEELEEEDSAHH